MTDPLPLFDPGREPVLEDLSGWVEPIDLLQRARARRHPVLLHSGLPSHPGSRWSIFACDPLWIVSLRGRTLRAVAAARPADEPQLLAVHGIGPTLARKYGKQLLAIVGEAE